MWRCTESIADRVDFVRGWRKRGESWVLTNLPKKYGDQCPLQNALAPLTPQVVGDRWERYDVSRVKDFEMEKLVYFGMSVFWRSAVRDWKTSTGQKAPSVDLGAPRARKALANFELA
jgi:hypothetical protein